jgi:hypothetical protein
MASPEIIRVPDYDASPRQAKFHTSGADETLYGGAAGGGKTAALVAEGVTVCLEHPGITVYIFRRTIPELKATIIPEVHRQCAAYIKHGHLVWHGSDRQFRFRNGSTLQLAYCDSPTDIYRYQGVEIPVLLIDEVTHFPFDWYEYLKTRVRSTRADWPKKIMAATNPGNIGHGWVKERFLKPMAPETLYTEPNSKKTRIFIPAKVDDHPDALFREQYKGTLSAIVDDHLRRALLEGDWNQFEGQVFTEWSREKHVIDPFEIPEHWVKWFGYDWGIGNGAYAAGLWFAKDPGNNRTYVYREFYETGMVTSLQGETIKMMENENIRIRFGDPSIFKSRPNVESTETINDIMQKQGLKFTPANNNRLHRVNVWHEMLAPAEDGLPKLQVFSNCYNLIRTLPDLPYDKHKVEDVDTLAEDHLYDAGGYGLVGAVTAKAKKPKREHKYNENGRLIA